MNPVVPDVLAHAQPATALERKFSMQFCAAAALAEGRVDFASFTDGEVANAEVRELMAASRWSSTRRCHRARAARLEPRDGPPPDGRTLATEPRGRSGPSGHPLSDPALREKFLACAKTVLSTDEAEGVAEQIGHLEDIPDIRALTSRLEGDLD